ncbi:TPA: hypothetical protein ACXI1M_001179 [Clostridioides difficile]
MFYYNVNVIIEKLEHDVFLRSNELSQSEFDFLQNFIDFFDPHNKNEYIEISASKFLNIKKEFENDYKEHCKFIKNGNGLNNIKKIFEDISYNLSMWESILFDWE